MFDLKEIKRALLTSLWFVFLTFPIMVIKVDPIERIVRWRWENSLYVAVGTFLVYLLVKFLLHRKTRSQETKADSEIDQKGSFIHRILANPKQRNILIGLLLAVALAFPHFSSSYQTNVMTTALMYVVLGLGLNIVVGMAGLLDLGYVAFYAVGAYSYALLNLHFRSRLLGGTADRRRSGSHSSVSSSVFRSCVCAAIISPSSPSGLVRSSVLILENWSEFSKGPSGISNIPRPGLFGVELSS